MELSRLSAVLRPRGGWESVDLGFALARRWFLPLWTLWWIAALPAAASLLLLLHDQPGLWLLTLWWLKPLYESLLLRWLSRALFGEVVPLVETARQIGQAFPPRLWPHLLWRRLGLRRSFTMPVTLLERLSGRRRRERLRVLRDGSGIATWLSIICVHLETVLWVSALLLIAFLVPDELPGLDLRAALLDDGSLSYWLATLSVLAAMSVIAPFYVAAGFALYLGRRTDLEAWDLELRFRHGLAPRRSRRSIQPGAQPSAGGQGGTELRVALLAMCLFGSGLICEPVPAQTGLQSGAFSPEVARALIDEVLAGEDFGSTRTEEAWVYVGDIDLDEQRPDDDSTTWLPREFILAIASLLKWALMIAAAAALLLLGYRLWLELRGLRVAPRGRDGDGKALPSPISDGAATLQPLPDDISTAVRALLAAGDARGALSLLYRAQIAHLRASGLDIPDSATEADCLEAAARVATPDQLAWLSRLTGLWQQVAYAHRHADPIQIGNLIDTHPSVLAALRAT